MSLKAIVTGGGAGIGLATATLLAERGMKVACLDINPPGDPFIGIKVDVTDDAGVRAAVAEAAERLGGIDIAGQQRGHRRAGHGRGQRRRRVAPRVRRQRVRHGPRDPGGPAAPAGVASTRRSSTPARSRPPPACRSARSTRATKGAVLSLTLAMAADHVREGIRVNCVNPGTADTPWVGRLLDAADDPEAERAALNARQPMGRLVSADEVAAAIAYLAGPWPRRRPAPRSRSTAACSGLRLRPRTKPVEGRSSRGIRAKERAATMKFGPLAAARPLLAVIDRVRHTELQTAEPEAAAGRSASTTPAPTPTSGTPTSSTCRSSAGELRLDLKTHQLAERRRQADRQRADAHQPGRQGRS